MKTFENNNPQNQNEETKRNQPQTPNQQPTAQPKTTQPGDALNTQKDITRTPQSEVQDPSQQTKQPSANQNPQIPEKQPQEDPIRKQPHINPDPTTPGENEKRTDPYASKGGEKDQSTKPNDLKEQNDLDAYPETSGKTKDTSINESTSHKQTNINPATERNKDASSIDREDTRK